MDEEKTDAKTNGKPRKSTTKKAPKGIKESGVEHRRKSAKLDSVLTDSSKAGLVSESPTDNQTKGDENKTNKNDLGSANPEDRKSASKKKWKQGALAHEQKNKKMTLQREDLIPDSSVSKQKNVLKDKIGQVENSKPSSELDVKSLASREQSLDHLYDPDRQRPSTAPELSPEDDEDNGENINILTAGMSMLERWLHDDAQKKGHHHHQYRSLEQREWVLEMRGYSSEPVLPLPFDKKFELKKPGSAMKLKPYMKKLKRKYLSMDDIFLNHDGYPDLLRLNVNDSSEKRYAVREEMIRSWDELFELERSRYSFFDELFARGYVLDSLEVPGPNGDKINLVAAEPKDFRSNLDFGRVVFKTKNIYTGQFKDKHFDGIGRYQWIDGTTYEGHFKDGNMHGHGKIEWEDGSLYEGEFLDGTREGWGIYSTIQGYTYIGYWSNGLPHGLGKMWYNIDNDNSDYYDGHWVQGIQDGVGTRQYPNGDRYIGQFTGGIRHGKGTMIWLNERQVYKGRWKDGVPHGLGTHIWYLPRTKSSTFPARHMYKGQWVEGKRDGIGKMVYPCGSVYEGRWKDGQRFAKGLFVNPAGELLVGLFRAGSVCGGTEVPLHAPPYECDYSALVDWINKKFHLEVVEKIDEKIYKLIIRNLELFRKLYKRAGRLGQSWGNNGLYPSWLKRTPLQEEHDTNTNRAKLNQLMTLEDPPHMWGKDVKPRPADNVYPVYRFGLWLLLKDIPGLVEHVTMAKYDDIWSECSSLSFQTRHNPFEPVYLWQFLQCLIIVAVCYYIDRPNRIFKLRNVVRKTSAGSSTSSLPYTQDDLLRLEEELANLKFEDCAEYISEFENEDAFEDAEEEYFEEEEEYAKRHEEEEEEAEVEEIGETADELGNSRDSKETNENSSKNGTVIEQENVVEAEIAGEDPPEAEEDGLETESNLFFDIGSPTSQESLGGETLAEPIMPMTIYQAVEKLIMDKLIKVLRRPAGKRLPIVPNPLPSLSDLYASFKSVNGTDVIEGREFLLSVIPHDVYPCPDDAIYWHRSKENLSSRIDYESLKKSFNSEMNLPKEEENTLGEEFLGSTINNADMFTSMIKNEAEPEFEHCHRTTVEILQHDRPNLVFNFSEPINSTDAKTKKLHREKFDVVRDPEEMYLDSNPFDDADLAKEPFLYTQTRTCDHVKKKPFAAKWLGAPDVNKVFKQIYPKLTRGLQNSNIPSNMVFCDWLWCTSLCARVSADREYFTIVTDEKQLRPRLFHPAPHIGIHSPDDVVKNWKHHSHKLGDTDYYLGEVKELRKI